MARGLAAPLQALGRTFLEAMGANHDVVRATVMQDIGRDQRRVKAYVDDADAIDTTDWAFGLLRSFFNATLPVFALAAPSELQSTSQQGFEDFGLADLLRGYIAVLGAIEAVKSHAPRERSSS